MKPNAHWQPILIRQWWSDRGGRVIRVELRTYQGTNVLDIRRWETSREGVLRPTQQGLTCSVKHLPDLLGALAAAARKIAELSPATESDP
jgi:hypothetical protein